MKTTVPRINEMTTEEKIDATKRILKRENLRLAVIRSALLDSSNPELADQINSVLLSIDDILYYLGEPNVFLPE